MAWMSQWDLHLGVENADWTKKITKKQQKKKVLMWRVKRLWRSLLEHPHPAPETRVRDPLRCDGADPGGLHQHKTGATGL